MDPQRGRSPSAGHQQNHINSHSPSPQPFQNNPGAVGLGLGIENQVPGSNQQQFMNNNFNSSNGIPSFVANDFMNQQSQPFSQGGLGANSYAPSTDYNSMQFKQEEQSSPFNNQQNISFTQDLMNASNFNEGSDFPLFTNQEDYDPSFFPSDPSTQHRNQSVNPSQLDMSSPQTAPTPPGLLQPDGLSPVSAHQSPNNFNTNQFQPSPNHSRHASLGPESAAFPRAQNVEWGMMPPQFTGHRRTPSEYSDVSVSSAHHSPNLGHHDSFDGPDHGHHSPMQQPQDSIYENVLGIGNFSLTDNHIQHGASPRRGLSPAHSPAISPRLDAQQLPVINQQNTFMLGGMNHNGFGQNMYNQGQESFPQLQNDMGQAQQMVPPEINVEFAPASRQNSFEPPKPSLDQDALTPPDRG